MNPFAPDTDDLLDWGRRLVNAELAELELGVRVQSFVLPGHSAQVLTRASGRGSLLVIGSHGHSGLTTRLLGLVASHC
ncbi:MAG TPA: universal stress protein, partial [Kribbellaceae bacterium]